MPVVINWLGGNFDFWHNFATLMLLIVAKKICNSDFTVSRKSPVWLNTFLKRESLPRLSVPGKNMYVSVNRFVDGIQSEMKKVISVFCLVVLAVSGVFASSPQKHVELLMVDSATGLAGVTSILLYANTSPLYNSNEDISMHVDTTSSTPQLFSFSSDNVP